MEIDRKWLEIAAPEKLNDGSTGICMVIENNRIVVANTGDCRAVMYRGGQCVVLSKDHKPTDPAEMKRIEDNGGLIIGDRLQGELAVSRAFGDYRYKIDERSLLICEPDINPIDLTPDIEFIIVACDGLYETFSNEEVIEYVKKALEDDKSDIKAIAKALADEAIDRGSGDNITVIIIKFDKKYRKILNRLSRKRQDELIKEKRKSLGPLKKSAELNEKPKSLEPENRNSKVIKKNGDDVSFNRKPIRQNASDDIFRQKRKSLEPNSSKPYVLEKGKISEAKPNSKRLSVNFDGEAKKRVIPRSEDQNFDDTSSVSSNEEFPMSDNFHADIIESSYNRLNTTDCHPYEIDTNRKHGGTRKSKGKKGKSKDISKTNNKLKKCKSKEDILSLKYPKVLSRRRSKSHDISTRAKQHEKRQRRKRDSSSDELEKDQKNSSSSKKDRKSVSFNQRNQFLSDTMDESLLTKNVKGQSKPKSPDLPKPSSLPEPHPQKKDSKTKEDSKEKAKTSSTDIPQNHNNKHTKTSPSDSPILGHKVKTILSKYHTITVS
jgi:serine/threonine protein phosphatase PrpC